MSPLEKQLAAARVALTVAQRRDVHGHQNTQAIEAAHYDVQVLAAAVRRESERTRRTSTDAAVAKADGAELVGRLQLLTEARRACTTPIQLDAWERAHGAELASIDARIVALQAPPPALDPLAAHREAVRQTHARLLASNPIAASAFERRHPEIHEPELEPPPAAA